MSPAERKELKRSDPLSGDKNRPNANQLLQGGRKNATVGGPKDEPLHVHDFAEDDEYIDEDEDDGDVGEINGQFEDVIDEEDNVPNENGGRDGAGGGGLRADNQPSHNTKQYSTIVNQDANKKAAQTSSSPSINSKQFDKVLLIPQERYKPALPKIIITASASVSDANGKKLNYSLGNVLGQQGKDLKIPPSTYDDYKEEDVVLDPFFLDVPKILQQHSKK